MTEKSGAGFGAHASASVIARPKTSSGVRITGVWDVKCYDADRNLKWHEKDLHNDIVTEGLYELLDCALSAATPETLWYVGLKDTGSPAAADTLPSHAGWAELSIYSGDRKSFGDQDPSAAASPVIQNASAASFAITSADDVYGCFLCSVATTTTGKLFSAVDFTAPRTVEISDTLEVTYSVTAADDGA